MSDTIISHQSPLPLSTVRVASQCCQCGAQVDMNVVESELPGRIECPICKQFIWLNRPIAVRACQEARR